MNQLTDQELITIAQNHATKYFEKDIIACKFIAELCARLTGKPKKPEIIMLMKDVFDNDHIK